MMVFASLWHSITHTLITNSQQFSFLQLSQRAGEIYNSFLSSKATMPVNIDSQAQLADDVLTSPRPDMFKTQQLQVATRQLLSLFISVPNEAADK